jgi:hypothetical protein
MRSTRAGFVRGRCDVGGDLQAPEEVRLLKDHRGGVLRGLANAIGVRHSTVMRHLDHVQAEAWRVRLHDLSHLRARCLGDDDLRPARCVLRDEAGVGRNRRAVVPRCVRDVHAGQLADRGLVFEDRLEHALAHLWLVRRVGGQELTALKHGVDNGGDVVVVHAASEEAHLVDDVLRCELLHVALQLPFRQRRRDVQRSRVTEGRRDVPEQLVDGGHTDRGEHLLAVGIGEREIAHCVSSTFL